MIRYILKLCDLSVPVRKLIRVFLDILAISFGLISICKISNTNLELSVILATILSGPIIFAFFGLYGSLTKYFGSRATYKLIFSNLLLSSLVILYQIILSNDNLNFNFFYGLLIVLSSFTGLIRIILKQILTTKIDENIKKKFQNIVIYGAGSSGAQFEASLALEKSYKIKFFIDDSSLLWGRNINGIIIKSPSALKKYKDQIDNVIITQDNLNRERIREIISELNEINLKFMIVPSIKNLIDGKVNFDLIKKVEIEDLLGRTTVAPDKNLMSNSIKGKVVCVTGAGGSIGSELCIQIINNKPKLLILIDSNEFNLYNIDLNLRELKKDNISIKSILGSVNNSLLLESVFSANKIDVVFHASAYKHVPLIEENPLEGIVNNIFATQKLCQAAIKFKIKKLILISSDKAVRPSNIMGATKRAAELIIQAYAKYSNYENYPCFSAVRFGNVLGSSGSVVPLFKKQISRGGPITITHPKIIRYFMTIKEASQLVIQATSMAKNGEIFLLDMGEPVKILDLAKQMIQLSGLTVKENNNDGDIEIKITGIRAGEKLYEELLIDGQSKKTKHPLIYIADENEIDLSTLNKKLEKLKRATDSGNCDSALNVLSDLIPEWNRKS